MQCSFPKQTPYAPVPDAIHSGKCKALGLPILGLPGQGLLALALAISQQDQGATTLRLGMSTCTCTAGLGT